MVIINFIHMAMPISWRKMMPSFKTMVVVMILAETCLMFFYACKPKEESPQIKSAIELQQVVDIIGTVQKH